MRYADVRCTYEETHDPHTYKYTGPCLLTGKLHTVTIPAEELFAYRQGKLIQHAMVSLSQEDREFLLTGHTAEGLAILFDEQEETHELALV